jgi:tRNA dimethylallyltransferase
MENRGWKMANIPALHPPSSILHPRPVFLAGPTAVGKSAVALALAEKIGGEIITVDSMQVYRGLDIGTAKPTPAERARVPHHLIDVCDLHEAFDAAQFIQLAQKAVAEIQSRGRTPIFCGGTGLYFKAFRDGLGEAPPTDENLRDELAATPLETLLAELRERDPAAYEKIDRQNPRRVIRAVAVIRLTGKPFSAQKSRWGETPGEPALPDNSGSRGRSPHQPNLRTETIFCFTRAAEDLHRRINVRVDEMFARGLVAETRGLLQRGLAENKFAMQAIGYRQVVEHLRGERALAATIELVKSRTRQFAKRQLTWFRRHGNCEWIELKPDETVEETETKIGLDERGRRVR